LEQYSDLNEKVCIRFFSTTKQINQNDEVKMQCAHIGYLIKNGYNNINGSRVQRWKCSRCNKRFGSDITMWNLLEYQEKIKTLLYELFILQFNQQGLSKKFKIPHDMLSRFKRFFVEQQYLQNTCLFENIEQSLPRGIMVADETFMGKRGNSNVEIMIINNLFQVLATGPAEPKLLQQSIRSTFEKIPESCLNKLRVLISDGEPAYKQIPLWLGGKVVHLQCFHNKKQLGQVTINKYEKLGPHHFHYKIKTHWKAFVKGTHILKFKWEIKFIKGRVKSGRGRRLKSITNNEKTLKWRQKLELYNNGQMKTSGTGSVFINFKTDKISLRKGGNRWMVRMLQPLFKIYKGKHLTSNLIESKNSQVKRHGGDRKQQDAVYGHKLFSFCAFVAEHD